MKHQNWLNDDVYFCTGCCQFHKEDSNNPVEISGVEFFMHPDTNKLYRIRKPKSKPQKLPKKGFGNT